MKLNRLIVNPTGNKLNLLPLGDVHLGAKECDYKTFEKYIKWIKQTKDLQVILMGDLINCGLRGSIGAGSYDDSYNVQEQYERMLDYLMPITDKICLLHNGNHENRIYKETGFDISKNMARELGVTYGGWSAYTHINVGGQIYSVFSTHGSSGASQPHTKMKKCVDMAYSIDADIYIMGHVHSLQAHFSTKSYYNRKNKTLYDKKKVFVLSGHFLNYDGSYAEEKNYKKEKKGAPKLKLYKNEWDIHVQL